MSATPSRLKFWVVTVAALCAVAVTGSLGVWQVGRAHLKEALLAQRQSREAMPEVGWPALQEALDQGRLNELWDRPVRLRGQWLAPATVFLDNRPMGGRSGFFVVTPLLPEGGGAALLVQRGWVARSFTDRTALPTLVTPPGTVEVVGRFAPAPSKLYELDLETQGPIRQNIDLESFAAEWSQRMLMASVLQSDPPHAAPDGLLRDWPRVGADVHKHYGYAFQWFGLCTLIVLLYVWFQIIAPRRRRG